jgi:hypothetical protein
MMSFSFTAPTLFEADAETDAILSTSEVFYNASRESLERLVKIKKFVVWLKAEMEKAGLPTKEGLVLDAESGGWIFEVASNEGFVMCIVSNLDGEGTRTDLLVTEIGGAAEGVDRAVEALLNRSSEIVDLEVHPG